MNYCLRILSFSLRLFGLVTDYGALIPSNSTVTDTAEYLHHPPPLPLPLKWIMNVNQQSLWEEEEEVIVAIIIQSDSWFNSQRRKFRPSWGWNRKKGREKKQRRESLRRSVTYQKWFSILLIKSKSLDSPLNLPPSLPPSLFLNKWMNGKRFHLMDTKKCDPPVEERGFEMKRRELKPLI